MQGSAGARALEKYREQPSLFYGAHRPPRIAKRGPPQDITATTTKSPTQIRHGKQHSGRRFQYEALGPRIFATLGLKARRGVSHVRPQCALPERARAEHEDAGSDPDREGRARTLIPPSEPALGDDQNISWSHLDIRRYIAVFEKAIEVDGQLLGMIVHPAHD